MFHELDFDVFEGLGQRNLSGFIGEVFVHSFAKLTPDYASNPHADGRPDLLDLSSQVSRDYLSQQCFTKTEEGQTMPVRHLLAPYRYGGLEVKCSIGSPIAQYKKALEKDLGKTNFEIGLPRINYLNTITYWGHHVDCENLLGLYYDYYDPADGVPQILAVMHSELVGEEDWTKVSVVNAGSKKTSNTSLNSAGKIKMFNGVVAVIEDNRYLENLSRIGLSL